MDVLTTVTPELERRLKEMAPWMHPFRFDDRTIVGFFKYQHGDEPNVSVPSSDEKTVETMQASYEQAMRGDPLWHLRELSDRRLLDGSVLDIACATGMFSFGLADLGCRDVLGVEIRAEQVEQAELVRTFAPERFSAVRFEHDPTSADDPGFRAGESYDVVLSLGLLYHLADPLQHLRNLRRLTGRALLLSTFTTPGPGWRLVAEDPTLATKATSGVSWIPCWSDIPDLLRAVGFSTIETIASPLLAELQAWDRRRPKAWEYLLPLGAEKLLERHRSRRYMRQFNAALAAGVNARYHTFLAS